MTQDIAFPQVFLPSEVEERDQSPVRDIRAFSLLYYWGTFSSLCEEEGTRSTRDTRAILSSEHNCK